MDNSRIPSLDRTKGFCVFLMVFFSATGFFPRLGIFYRLAANTAGDRFLFLGDIAFADFMTPMFLFLVGMSYVLSFQRRFRRAGRKAYLHFLSRYTLFLGLGSLLVSLEKTYKGKSEPFVLRALFFLTLSLVLLLGIGHLFPHFRRTLERKVSRLLLGTILLLGVLGIFYALKDTLYIFTSRESLKARYEGTLMHWSILHVIGMTGLWGLLFVALSTRAKIIAWLLLALSHTALQLIPGVVDTFGILVLGGFAGTLGWLQVLLSGMIAMELYSLDPSPHPRYLVAVLVVGLLAIPASLFLEAKARAVTENFILLSIVLLGGIFYVFSLLDHWKPKFSVFLLFGRNPLLTFCLGGVFKILLMLWDPKPDTPVIISILYMLLAGSIILVTDWYLDRKGRQIRL